MTSVDLSLVWRVSRARQDIRQISAITQSNLAGIQQTWAGPLAGIKVQRILNGTSSRTRSLMVKRGIIGRKVFLHTQP